MSKSVLSLKALRELASDDESQVTASLSAELLGIELSADDGSNKSEVDVISKRLSELQEELLTSLKEDLSEWIVKTLASEKIDITASNFIEALDTGIILCKLSMVIEKKAQESIQPGADKEPLHNYKLHCDETATSGTWYARDNTANFLKWCRAYGMTDEMLFDTEDLVTHHHQRQVIYCLMELARLAARFGLEPPSLISMEKEIDGQVTTVSSQDNDTMLEEEEEAAKGASLSAPASTTEFCALEGPDQVPLPPKTMQESILDMEVYRVTLKCQCEDHVNKLSEGVFDVYGKRVFIRLLQGRHLMIRVGGGWDTFENYLLHHKPIQVFRFNHRSDHSCVFTETNPRRTGNKEYLHNRHFCKSFWTQMGCELAKNNLVVPEMPEEDGALFSDTQIDTIRSTWPLLSRDGVRVGVAVFMRIFRETPSIRRLFDPLGSQDLEHLEHHPAFRDHALKFMKVLDSLVQNMESPDVIQPHLVALGARHAAIEGYHPEYFRFYSKCLLEVWEMELGEEFISEVKECWKHVIKYIVRCMVQGYDICLSNQLDSFMKDCNVVKFDYT